jgi:putative endonuclease
MRMPEFLRPRTAKQIIGQSGEDDALAYLERQGLTLTERNFLCKGGEIDLIMQDREMLVFVEVRARAKATHGGAAASVTARKQARLILAAQVFLQGHREPPPCRIDVVAIDGGEIAWLQNAIET